MLPCFLLQPVTKAAKYAPVVMHTAREGTGASQIIQIKIERHGGLVRLI